MTILVINCGTSSVKVSVFAGDHREQEINGKDLSEILKKLDLKNVRGVGHRVVHGGEKYTNSVVITPAVLKELESLTELAPLHNPPSIEGIKIASSLFSSQIPQVAVFDTAFHKTIPPYASHYPLPWDIAKKHKIKRYGFHGISHEYLWKRFHEQFPKGKKVITFQLGSGCSLTAIKNGDSIDTSMGFTPLDGVMMATRSGAIDPAIVPYLAEKEKISAKEVISLLNRESGLLGVSKLSGDLRKLEESKDPQVELALQMFIYEILKTASSYLSVLEGVDAMIFSGGIGEDNALVRGKIAKGLSWLGVKIDPDKNSKCTGLSHGETRVISHEGSTIPMFVIATDENSLIAKETLQLLR